MNLIILPLCFIIILSCKNRQNESVKVPEKEAHPPIEQEKVVLRLMVWGNYTPESFVKAFEKEMTEKYEIPVILDISYLMGNGDVFNPVRAGTIDLITISHHIFKDERYNYIKKGLLISPDLDNIPNYSLINPDLSQADYHISNGIIYGIPLAHGPYGLAYNSKKTAPPKGWEVFWDPEFKNQYSLGREEYLYNICITALVMGYSRNDMGDYDVLNNQEFKNKLRQLTLNANTFWVGVDTPEDLIDLRIAASWGDSFSGLKERGEEWKMAEPSQGILWWIDDYALTWTLKDNPLKKMIAEEWINKSLSKEFQIEHVLRKIGTYPVIVGISNFLTPEEKKKIERSESGNFQDTHILQKTYSERDRNGLKLLWEEAMEGIEDES